VGAPVEFGFCFPNLCEITALSSKNFWNVGEELSTPFDFENAVASVKYDTV